jgi:FAD/FMN-containing dehydrogenase
MSDPASRGAVEGLDGTVIRLGERAYGRAWADSVWNGRKPERFPEVIVRVASERDIPRALARARAEGLRVSIRSGGHNWSGAQLRDRAMLIDLSELTQCSIDPDSATATMGPAVTSRKLAEALPPYGLAFPVGHCPAVAMGGYLLSGGLGWNSRAWGPACGAVEEIRAVTAEGRTVVCNETENADLFWAARGAGLGFFAVVTRFRLRLRPYPGAIATSRFTFPLSETERVAGWGVRTARRLPPNVETAFVLTASGPATGTVGPGPRLMLAATAFAATPAEAQSLLAPIDECPFAERALSCGLSELTSFNGLYEDASSAWPAEHRYAVDTLWSTESYETQLARGARLIAEAPSGKSHVLFPVEPVAPDGETLRNMAFSVLGESYAAAFAMWDDSAADEVNTRWLRQAMDALDPQGTGSHYIAEADVEAGPSRSRRSYSPADWEKLRRIKARWDPDDFFHSYLTA